MGVICSGEQKPSAGFEHVLTCSLLLALKTARVMFCVADGNGELGPPFC